MDSDAVRARPPTGHNGDSASNGKCRPKARSSPVDCHVGTCLYFKIVSAAEFSGGIKTLGGGNPSSAFADQNPVRPPHLSSAQSRPVKSPNSCSNIAMERSSVRKSNLYQTTGKHSRGPRRPAVHESFRRTERDQQLVEVLVHRVRVLSLQQVTRTWWAEATSKDALKRLRLLEQAGLLHLFQALSHPEISLDAPEVSWSPGQPAPNMGRASYRLGSRWNQSPVELHCAIATTLAARSFGGHGGRFPRESERTHDLHMSAVFLRYRLAHPELIPFWKSEARILWERGGLKKEKLPDAVLELPDQRHIVEFGGAYSKTKLESFHEYCSSVGASYEVW